MSQHLLKHFLSFEWNTFDQFSFDFNFNEILKYTNIDIWNEPFDATKGFSIYQSPIKKIKVVVLTMESLFNNINEIAPNKNGSAINPLDGSLTP